MSNSIYDTLTSSNCSRMYGNPICHVYIADGFQDDCEELIQKCVLKYDVLEYHMFCRIWKEMNMGCLYQERTSAAEVAELSEEVLHVAKHYMVSNTTIFEESVAGLFLVYSLMNLQPYQNFASLRLVPEDIPAIRRLESVARNNKRYDVLYILASVLIKGPCQFHAAERERGMEIPIKKYLDGFKSIDSVRGVKPKGVFYRQNEELDIIRELGTITKKYSEAKAEIFGPDRANTSLQYIDENMSEELTSSLKRLLCRLNEDDEGHDDDEENVASERNHVNAVEEIKFKAMREAVNPVKHLTGIKDRKQLTKTKKEKPKDKTESKGEATTNTIEPETSDPKKKRQLSPMENKKKKLKITENTRKVRNEAEINVVDAPLTLSDIIDESSGTEDEATDWAMDNTKERAVKSLPMLMTEMEHENDKSKTRPEAVQSMLPDLSSVDDATTDSSQDEMIDDEPSVPSQKVKKQTDNNEIHYNTNFPEKLLKKVHLKSKLKRLGMLNIANLD